MAPVLRIARLAAHLFERPLGFAPLSVDRLLADARLATGLEDFGKPTFLDPLSQLVSSLENEARLTPFGREVARTRLRVHLVNRLRLQADRAREPAIAQEKIVRPIFVVGPPRTGTSILFRVLAQDERSLSPMAWQIQTPSPPPPRLHSRIDARYMRALADEIFLRLTLPRLRAIRDTRADLPEECCVLQAHEFVSILFAIAFDVPDYQQMLLTMDHSESYTWHHAFLQQFQFGAGGGSWVLKSPGHLLSLPELFARYPDACIVQTHRDPLELVPSLSSLSQVLRSLSADPGDMHALGESVASFWATALERGMAFRRSNPDLAMNFFDVPYEEIAADPIEVSQRIYRHFGRPLSIESRARMSRFVAANPKGRPGSHRYSLEEFGLNRDVEARRFAGYRSTFGFDGPRQGSQ